MPRGIHPVTNSMDRACVRGILYRWYSGYTRSVSFLPSTIKSREHGKYAKNTLCYSLSINKNVGNAIRYAFCYLGNGNIIHQAPIGGMFLRGGGGHEWLVQNCLFQVISSMVEFQVVHL